MSSLSFNPRYSKSINLVALNPNLKASILDALPTNTTIRRLDCRENTFSDDDAEKVAAGLRGNTTLTHLSMRSYLLGYPGIEAVIDALFINSTLTSLCLLANHMPLHTAMKIGAMLEHNSTLQELNLQYSNICNPAAIALSGALRTNSTLTSLNLGGIIINDEAAIKIAESLAFNNTLSTVKIGNEIGDEGISALIDAIIHNTSLTELHIDRTKMTARSVPKIAELIKSTVSLKVLNIENSSFIPAGLNEIFRAVYLNGTITTLKSILPYKHQITADSEAIDDVCLRNKFNEEQRKVTFFELLYTHVSCIALEEGISLPPKDVKANFDNPHRPDFVDLSEIVRFRG